MRQVVQGSQGVHVGLPKRGAPRLQRALQQRLRLAVVSPLQQQPPSNVHQVGVLLCARRQQPHHRRHRAAQGALEHGVEARRAALVALDLRQYHVLVLGLECRRLLHLQVVHHLRQLLHLAGVQAVRQDLQLAGVIPPAAARLDRLVVLLQTPGPREADALRVHHHQRALRARHRLRQRVQVRLHLLKGQVLVERKDVHPHNGVRRLSKALRQAVHQLAERPVPGVRREVLGRPAAVNAFHHGALAAQREGLYHPLHYLLGSDVMQLLVQLAAEVPLHKRHKDTEYPSDRDAAVGGVRR
mmetsp:Transcript_25491/g.65631  ORF Transcript_25491/g.65631 Transcript_25491/m.65631 type:complete len:299 (+) Transcript_25491:1218-2114(+)